jgi:predicted metalloendopeptidase
MQYYYKPMKLSAVQEMVPAISFLDLIRTRVPKEFQVTPDSVVVVTDIDFYRNLTDIIKSTPRETLHDYFQWRLYSTWTSRMSRSFTTPLRRFQNVMAGKDLGAIQARYRGCIRDIDESLGHLLGAVYIQRSFTPKDKQIGDQIIQDIRKVFSDNMKNLDWMGSEAKEIAAQKGAYISNSKNSSNMAQLQMSSKRSDIRPRRQMRPARMTSTITIKTSPLTTVSGTMALKHSNSHLTYNGEHSSSLQTATNGK